MSLSNHEALLQHHIHDNTRLRVDALILQSIIATLAQFTDRGTIVDITAGLSDAQEFLPLALRATDPGPNIPAIAHLQPSLETMSEMLAEQLEKACELLLNLPDPLS